MKYFSTLLIYFLILFSCTSQTDKSNSEIKPTSYERIRGENSWGFIDNQGDTIIPLGKYKFLNPIDEEGMIFAELNGKHGFIDINQNALIPFIYDDLSVFSEGLAPAKKDDKWGYINRKGEVVISFQFDKERHFYKTGLSEASRDGKWGFINKKGKEVVPIKYPEVDCHKMEKELIFVCSKNKWAIFDKKGKQQSKFIYDEIYGTSNNLDYYDKKYLYNGLLLVRKGNQYRYLNEELEIVADFGHYTNAEPITEFGFAIVNKGDLYGVINSKGEIVIPCVYPKIEHPHKEYQGFYDEFYIHKNGKVGLLNREAKPITDITFTAFQCVYSYNNGEYRTLFIARKKNKYGLIGSNGEIILPIEYDEIGKFESNLGAIAKKNGLFGIINDEGKVKIPFEYSSITTYHLDENYVVEKNGKFGIIKKETLETIVPLDYEDLEVCFYDETHFIVKKNGRYGIIDKNLKIIVPFEYDKISNWVEYGPKEHFVVKNGKEGLISRNGKTVIPAAYDKIFVDNPTLIKVKENGFYGTINWKNEIVHPIQYEQILWEWPFLTGKALDTIYIKKSGKYFATDTTGKVIVKSVSKELINDKFETY